MVTLKFPRAIISVISYVKSADKEDHDLCMSWLYALRVVPMCPASKVGNNKEHVKWTQNVR